MIKAVFDTMVFLRALINPHGVNRKIVQKSSVFQLLVSAPIMEEIVDVLNRHSIREAFPKITDEKVKEMLDIVKNIDPVEIKSKVTICRDAKDNKFLECSLDGDADYLVTADEDLLVLKSYGQTKIIPSDEFIKILEPL